MRSDFMLAINQLCAERKLAPEVVLEAVEASLISAYRRNFGAVTNIEVRIEQDTGDVRVYAAKEVVEDVTDDKAEISLPEARETNPDAVLGDVLMVESTPRDFGRIAAQTAKQVILQRIREAERDALYSSFADSAGEIANGTIQSHDLHSGDVVVNLEGAEAVLPSREQVPNEKYRRGQRIRAYVVEVRKGSRGPQITLSRRSPALLRRLLELEVPEIFSGAVEIKAIAREAGSRSKVAVHATQEGVDPVGSCVGVRGGRIQNVVNELGGEKIDVVQWSPDVATFIANSLSPAKVMNVLLNDVLDGGKTATVIVPDRQLSLAIGKEGQNARLAAKLTNWRIDIKSATEAAEETLGSLDQIRVPPDEMDLLSLAEALLTRRDGMEGFSTEQRQLIQEAVKGDLEDWPQEEPTLEQEDAEPEPVVEEAEVVAEEQPAEVEVVAEPSSQLEDVEEAEEAEEAEGEPEVYESRRPAWLQDIEEPAPFLEEDVVEEGSLGWVPTEPAVPEYPSWVDEEPSDMADIGWLPDEEVEDEEEDEDARRERKKKGKKRRRREFDPEEAVPEFRPTPRRGRGGRGR
ncbi:MAG: transcription termination/antitermination protein NusA [Anaerolineaceae bacterium]|nr:transcription termination/antitermination protein NusA [Anaerolineaceae bacterium]